LHNIFELKVHFESKLILIQKLNEEDWIKLMYTKYITYNFSTAIGPLFMIHKTLPNKRIFQNNAMPFYKISSSLIW